MTFYLDVEFKLFTFTPTFGWRETPSKYSSMINWDWRESQGMKMKVGEKMVARKALRVEEMLVKSN